MKEKLSSFIPLPSSLLFSGRFRDLACFEATGANLLALDAAGGALDADRLQIGIEATARPIVRV